MTQLEPEASPAIGWYIPDGMSLPAAVGRTTHLAIGAHPDDLEFFAIHGILECFDAEDRWFCGVTCADGAGSARSGPYAHYDDTRMIQLRAEEQRQAARLGRYGALATLSHPSALVKGPARELRAQLAAILRTTRPRVVYLHNPADKHETHVAVTLHALSVLRELPAALQPERVLGVEVWRDLDWLPDRRKVLLDVSGREHLQRALCGVFDSQIAAGKRYDLAVLGRRLANATFQSSHAVDGATLVSAALDLSPLLEPTRSIEGFLEQLLAEFQQEVMGALRRFSI